MKKELTARRILAGTIFFFVVFFFAVVILHEERDHDLRQIGIISFVDDDYSIKDICNRIISRVSKRPGIAVTIERSHGSATLSSSQLDRLVDIGCKVIILVGSDFSGDYAAAEKAIFRANKAGCELISVEANVDTGRKYFVGTNPFDEGYRQGEYLRNALPINAKIVYLRGKKGSHFSDMRLRGFVESCLLYRPDVEVIADFDLPYSFEAAKDVIEIHLSILKQTTAVVAQNNEMALGARAAFVAAGLPVPACYGINGDSRGLAALDKGELQATAAANVGDMADAAAEMALDLLDGRPVGDRYFPVKVMLGTSPISTPPHSVE